MTTAHFFFFNDTATTEIYTLSLHDALPISFARQGQLAVNSHEPHRVQGLWQRTVLHVEAPIDAPAGVRAAVTSDVFVDKDRKSTRLNSSHANISYAVFCLKKKNKIVSILPE